MLACFAKNLLLFEMGFTLAFPTILITALTGLSPDQNPNESIHLMPSETTWIGEFPWASVSSCCTKNDQRTLFSEYFVHMSADR